MAKQSAGKLDKWLREFARRQEQQLQKIPDAFISQIEIVQQYIFDSMLDSLMQLKRDGDDIEMSTENIQIVEQLNKSIGDILQSSGYKNAVDDYATQFDRHRETIESYFKKAFDSFERSKFANKVVEAAKKNATELLSSATVTTKFLQPLVQQIDLAVSTGQSFTKTVQQVRTYATGAKVEAGKPLAGRDKPGGKMLQYSKQIAYDAIAISDRAYTNAVATELESEWFFFAGGILPTSREWCIKRIGKYFHYKEIEDWATERWQGKTENTDSENIYVLLGGHNCQHTLIPVSIDQVPDDVIARATAKGYYKPEEKQKLQKLPADAPMTDAQQQEFNEFPRQPERDENVKVQETAIKYFIHNKEQLVADYIEQFGNVANTDEARKLFDVVGYTGSNASAVHEAASALNKEVMKTLVEQGKVDHVVMYAGGAGSGKTSAIAGMFKEVKSTADVIIDGNMATYAKSIKQIDSFLQAGKTIDIMYVYRDPVDAWTNGVIKRMLENVEERGRVVPLRTFLENTAGSYDTIKGLMKLEQREGVTISLIDNSLGKGKTALMDIEKFNNIQYDAALKQRLVDETKKLVESGRITREQYEALIEQKYTPKPVVADIPVPNVPAFKDYEQAADALHDQFEKLPDPVKLTVRRYTDSLFSELNMVLRDPDAFKEIPYVKRQPKLFDNRMAEIAHMDAAFEVLPVYNGQSYRGMGFATEGLYRSFIERNLSSEMFMERAFFSTSTEHSIAINTAKYAAGSGNHVIMLNVRKGATGRALKRISVFEHEREVLFQRNSRWRIVDKVEKIDGQWTILEVTIEQI